MMCGHRKPPIPTMNEWKVCVLDYNHEGPHTSKDGTTWPALVLHGSANALT